ncbi:hypothetical protein GW17_00002173 [Ensete ventricosum]|nr:hypothetical protein GW17_00002173 [Ensete ventricosum]
MATGEYARGVLTPRLAANLYSSPSELLVDRALKSMVLLKGVRTGHRAFDYELLKLTGALEKLRVELPTETITKYKKSAGFEMSLVRTSQISYEYGYRVALALFKARYPDLEIKEDPFVLLPEDKNMLMEAEQPFDNSLPPPEE